jgi:hypothetical protein
VDRGPQGHGVTVVVAYISREGWRVVPSHL